ncbi:hypothetical protein EV198_0578 [Roseivirga ehrenbergii]|nr:hypothetical protein [Roseivirga ehrenbergii]TCL13748.1 hypothetical protein EV198_0578 [Roseivirga ehrenbergii]
MKNLLVLATTLILLFTSCNQSDDMNISDYVDHWEINTTFKTFENSTLDIDTVENEYKIAEGHNQVFIVTTEKNPVFKEGKELTDLYSTKSLLIELDTLDNLVTPENPSNSRLFQQLIAFSPDYGINPLDKEEKITFTRNNKNVWTIESDIYDFVFRGQLDFSTEQSWTNTINDY